MSNTEIKWIKVRIEDRLGEILIELYEMSEEIRLARLAKEEDRRREEEKIFIFSSFYLFTDTPTIRNFATVNRVVNYHSNEMHTPLGKSAVVTFYLFDTL